MHLTMASMTAEAEPFSSSTRTASMMVVPRRADHIFQRPRMFPAFQHHLADPITA